MPTEALLPLDLWMCKLFLVLSRYKKGSLTDHCKQPIWCLWVFVSITLFQEMENRTMSMAFVSKKKNQLPFFSKAVYIQFWHLQEILKEQQ